MKIKSGFLLRVGSGSCQNQETTFVGKWHASTELTLKISSIWRVQLAEFFTRRAKHGNGMTYKPSCQSGPWFSISLVVDSDGSGFSLKAQIRKSVNIIVFLFGAAFSWGRIHICFLGRNSHLVLWRIGFGFSQPWDGSASLLASSIVRKVQERTKNAIWYQTFKNKFSTCLVYERQ